MLLTLPLLLSLHHLPPLLAAAGDSITLKDAVAWSIQALTLFFLAVRLRRTPPIEAEFATKVEVEKKIEALTSAISTAGAAREAAIRTDIHEVKREIVGMRTDHSATVRDLYLRINHDHDIHGVEQRAVENRVAKLEGAQIQAAQTHPRPR